MSKLPAADPVPGTALFMLLGILFSKQSLTGIYPLPETSGNPLGIAEVLLAQAAPAGTNRDPQATPLEIE